MAVCTPRIPPLSRRAAPAVTVPARNSLRHLQNSLSQPRRSQLQQVRMARTESTQSELGTQAPDFKLPDVTSGRDVTLDDVAGSADALLVIWICNHCPFVIAIIDGLVAVAREFEGAGLRTAFISSNSVKTHPQDGPERMTDFAAQYGFGSYLYDESQEVAKAYGAVCTPDIFLYDADRTLRYRGQFDDSRPGNDKPVTGADLRAAIKAVLAGQPVEKQTPSIGCSIKWHPGA